MQGQLRPSLPWPPRALVQRTPGAWHQKQLGRLGGGHPKKSHSVAKEEKVADIREMPAVVPRAFRLIT